MACSRATLDKRKHGDGHLGAPGSKEPCHVGALFNVGGLFHMKSLCTNLACVDADGPGKNLEPQLAQTVI